MPPRARAKPAAEPAGLAASDSEPDLDMFDKSDLQAAVRTMSATKKPRGRPPGTASKIIKPAQRATRRTGKEKLPAVPEVVAQPDAAGKVNGTNAMRKAQQMAPDETLTFEDIEGPSSAPATGVKKGTRGRPKKGNGDTSVLAPESAVRRRGRPPRQPTTPIAEVPETQQDPMELDPVLEESENDDAGAILDTETIVPWSSYDTSDDSTRRRLEDLTRKYTALEASHRDLREVGVREAERNFERLKKQAEERTAAATKLIAELKAELATQTALANESEELRKQLEANETETENLKNTVKTLNSSVSEAKSEIKSLSSKLAAARSSDTNSRVPGSAVKTTGLMNRTAQAGAAHAHAAQVAAQAKERLYADLTDLILRGVKQDEDEDIFDCIQTGRNGTLHFKLAIENDASDNYEDVSFTYQPQLDPGRDQELIDVLPGYLTEEITFPRSQAPKFYSRVNKSLTEDLTRQ
ncbi:chromosome segregation protein pcs1 [Fusarium langsethiae]|uniref:Chromosome segregation protein pcs1 n=1 Tax=Fusarium langsethiae TaxID=179993 RepID=A0A0N0V7N1_FUSLA|nr:chromosome segregation protein pcs1 [Fusarium langsethiae]GKU02068.1 unnamed protein product [Fusarium langsethiae]GKU15160.1 unnamed protein product [Fusarium langsethiae]